MSTNIITHKSGWRFNHFTAQERGKIEAYLKDGCSKRQIAKELNKSDTAVRKEIKRGWIELPRQLVEQSITFGYVADTAQWQYERRKKRKRQLKAETYPEILEVVVKKLDEQRRIQKPWSLNATIGRLNAFPHEFNINLSISSKTIYNYLHDKRVESITNKYLFYSKNRKIYHHRPTKRQNGLSISERPIEVNNRSIFNHYEIDTIKSRRGDNECLLNIIERKTRFSRLRKMKECTPKQTILTIDKLEKKKEILTGGTCTGDNGSEFNNVKGLEASSVTKGKRMTMYYTQSYSSWQKGSVEQSNGIYRIMIPKRTLIRDLTDKEIQDIEDWQNDYPRKQFGYKTAREMYNMYAEKFLTEEDSRVRTF